MIYVDPPWRYQNWKGQGVAERHYPTMTLEDIKALPVTGLLPVLSIPYELLLSVYPSERAILL